MKKGELLEGIVTRVDYPGKGVVETPEGICIVKNVLPGQHVRLRVSKKGAARQRESCRKYWKKLLLKDRLPARISGPAEDACI